MEWLQPCTRLCLWFDPATNHVCTIVRMIVHNIYHSFALKIAVLMVQPCALRPEAATSYKNGICVVVPTPPRRLAIRL